MVDDDELLPTVPVLPPTDQERIALLEGRVTELEGANGCLVQNNDYMRRRLVKLEGAAAAAAAAFQEAATGELDEMSGTAG